MVKVHLHPGSTLRQGSATVEVGPSRPEVRGRRRRGTATWGAAGVCVDVAGSANGERIAVALAVASQLIPGAPNDRGFPQAVAQRGGQKLRVRRP